MRRGSRSRSASSHSSSARCRAPFWRFPVLGGLWVIGLGTVYAALHRETIAATFWPPYTGYVGNKGERNLEELVAQNLEPVRQAARLTLQRYFLYDRATFEPRLHWFEWDVRLGGLVFLPLALLGLVGVADAVRHPGRGRLWIAVTAAGFVIPALSTPTARRFLVFDLGWCALAAAGFLALLRSRLGRALPARAAPWAAAGPSSRRRLVLRERARAQRHPSPAPRPAHPVRRSRLR